MLTIRLSNCPAPLEQDQANDCFNGRGMHTTHELEIPCLHHAVHMRGKVKVEAW